MTRRRGYRPVLAAAAYWGHTLIPLRRSQFRDPMADTSSDATMEALARLSILQATLLALAWPVLLLALPYGLALVRRAIVLMSSNHSDGIQAMVGFHMRVASWPALILLLVVPPVIFLFAWRTAKRA